MARTAAHFSLDDQTDMVLIDKFGLKPFYGPTAKGFEFVFYSRPENTEAAESLEVRVEGSGEIGRCGPIFLQPGTKIKLERPPPPVAGSLRECLKDSPYQQLLELSTWVEFSDVTIEAQLSGLLGSWINKPRLRFATSLLFAGAILVQQLSGEAIQLSSVESYGRERDADSHSEVFQVMGNSGTKNSHPRGNGFYDMIWPTVLIYSKHDHRLVLGCPQFNILVTGLKRLDGYTQSCTYLAGRCASAFSLGNDTESENVRIFLDKKQLQLALAYASGTNIPVFDVWLLRQTRSYHGSLHSYIPGKATWEQIKYLYSGIPVSTFSLASSPQSTSTKKASHVASSLLRHIATEVHVHEKGAQLDKHILQDLRRDIAKGTKVPGVLDSILQLFKEGETSIDIIGNQDLERMLDMLPGFMAQNLSLQNKNAEVALNEWYRRYFSRNQ